MEGISQNRYLVEIEGIAQFCCSECTPPEKQHTPVELYESNKPNPNLVRGNFKISDVSFKHAYGINDAAGDCFRWLNDFSSGTNVQRRSARLMVMTEDGLTPLKTYEMERCVPLNFKPETFTASGNDPGYFTFMIRPEDFRQS